uniref:C2H2-type domain-containing protein n=1 Tax=Strongyloides papillosus TaxID=174720 RepID=A0A0N5C185_STREA
MDGKRAKFVCPHCDGVMGVDMIYFHVRGIFNSPLYKCRQCDFSTNGTFHRDHHKSLTGHQLDGNNNLDPFLEEAINSATTVLMNSVIHRSENISTVENVAKSNETREIDSSKQSNGGNGNSINTNSVQRIDDSEQRKKFFLDTINSIDNMSFKCKKNNSSSRGVEVVEISLDPESAKQKYNVPIPSFGKSKMVLCQKCGEVVDESYLTRRKHVFLRHQD